LISTGLSSAYLEKLKECGVTFNQDKFKNLNDFISKQHQEQPQILHLITPSATRLGAVKVAQALEQSPNYKTRDSYLFMRLSTLLRSETQKKIVGSFQCPDKYNLLVIDCNSAPTEGIQTLHEKLLKGINSEIKKKK
jgi:hypothetical protein